MVQKKKIGLVTWVGGPNYGTVLQAYALYSVIVSLGYDVEIIRKYDFVWGVKKSLDHLLAPLGVHILKNQDPDNLKFRRIRTLQAATFRYCRVVGPFGRGRARRRFDAFICGSDQMWNVRNCFDPFFFLDFAGDKPRISYAVSIGTDNIAEEFAQPVRRLLAPFQAISVRETTGERALGALTGRGDIKTVLDPVFLMGKEGRARLSGWKQFADYAVLPSGLPSRYVLCYVLGRVDDSQSAIRKALETLGEGAAAVVVPSGEYPEFSFEGEFRVEDAGAREFVALIASASAVVTDSFHGTAFSLIFDVPVVTLKRFADDDPASQNSRIYDLLAQKDRLSALREESFSFLEDSLK